jgi:hypothetical protein
MDLFGSLNFSKLIKTFLPGFMLCIAMFIYFDMLVYFIVNKHIIFSFAIGNAVLFTLLLIPFSIIFGVLSNTVFFIFGYERIIFRNYKKCNSELLNFENEIKGKIKRKIQTSINLDIDQDDRVLEYLDVKSFYLHKMDTEKISFVKDSFWYYLEFQLNILLGIDFLIPALLFVIIKQGIQFSIHYLILSVLIILFILLLVALNILLIKSARKNFKHYKMKYLSLLLGAYSFEKIS